MPGAGIIWGAIIIVPFWLIIIKLVITGVIAVKTLLFVGLSFLGLLLLLIITSSLKAKRDKEYWDVFIENINTYHPNSSPRPIRDRYTCIKSIGLKSSKVINAPFIYQRV